MGRLKVAATVESLSRDWPLNYDVMAFWPQYFLSQNTLEELYLTFIVQAHSSKCPRTQNVAEIRDYGLKYSICTQS